MTKTSKDGVYTKTLKNGLVSYYITYRKLGKLYKKKLGTNLEGWSINKAHKERLTHLIDNQITPQEIIDNTEELTHELYTLNDIADRYFWSIRHKSDFKNTIGRYNNHIKDVLGSIAFDKVSVSDVQRLKALLMEKVSSKTNRPLAPKTANDMINLVNTIYIYEMATISETKDKRDIFC